MTEHRRFGSDFEREISLDPWSGKTLYISPSTSGSFAVRVLAANEALHTGALFGVLGRSLMALAGVALFPQAIIGLVMFWKRTRRKKGLGWLAR
jgi:uncharacterized iron-regulated membrane protein